MSELVRPLPLGTTAARTRDTFSTLNLRLPLTWEAAAYGVLIACAFGFRLWDLGSRAMHHDESLHSYYAYQILQGHGYEHSPVLPGPFQFFGTALTFFLTGGASDTSARILPALFGGVLVLLPLLLRSRLGRLGALVTATLIAFSPTLMYYSRFAREDIYAAVFTLGIVICVWRYIDEEKPHYLYISAALLALSFATKETTFVFTAIMLIFLDLWAALEFAGQARGRGSRMARGSAFLGYAPFAWAIAALWPFIGGIRKRLGLQERHPAVDVLVVMGTLAGPQFAAAVKVPLEGAGMEISPGADERALAIAVVLALVDGSVLGGQAWGRWVAVGVGALLAALGADGFADGTGVEVAQGLALALAAVTLVLAVKGDIFERFLVCWSVTSLVAYSLVGEKMPWLTVHTTLPLVILAGYSAGRFFSWLAARRKADGGAQRSRFRPGRAVAIAVAAPIAVLALLSMRTAILATYDHGDVPREFLVDTRTW